MSQLEDFALAVQGDPDAERRLISHAGPFIHCAMLSQLSTRAAASAVAQLLSAAPKPSTAASALAWWGALLGAARARAAQLALEPANTIEQPDESPAGSEARRLLGSLRPLSSLARELVLLRLVQGIGADELSQVLGLPVERVRPKLSGAVREALTLLGATVADREAPYLTEPQTGAPLAAVVALENKLELLRYNESLPAVSSEPIAPARAALPLNPEAQTQVVHPLGVRVGGAAAEATPSATARVPTLPEAPTVAIAPLPPTSAEITQSLAALSAAQTTRTPAIGDETQQRQVLPISAAAIARAPTRLLAPLQRLEPLFGPFPAFWVAGLLAVLGVAMAVGAIRLSEHRGKGSRPLETVLVAAVDLPEGTRLDRGSFAERQIPLELAGNTVLKPDNLTIALGKPLHFPMQAGDPLLWTHFSSASNDERLSARLSKRIRAYAIPVDGLTSLSGMVRPGDRLDVLLSLKPPPSEGVPGRVASTLLQDVPVLAVGLVSPMTIVFPQGRAPEYANLTLGVPVEEAEVLALANRESAIRLTLRHPDDHTIRETHGLISIRELLDASQTPRLLQRRQATINLIRDRPAPTR